MHIRIDASILIAIAILFLVYYLWKRQKENRRLLQSATTVTDDKRYILWVTTEQPDGGYTERWYGWSRDMILTYDEAIAEKAKIDKSFTSVNILEVQRIPNRGETNE